MLILLDIDGVMVPAAGWKAPVMLDDGFPAFSHRASKALDKIIAATDASILLTTSHKARYTVDEWKKMFLKRGLDVDLSVLIAAAPWQTRADEILTWAAPHSTGESFVIIDDDKSLNNLPESIKHRLVLTSPLIGLTGELADEAIKILCMPAIVQQ